MPLLPNKRDLLELIRRGMHEAKLSQEKLAELVGIDQSAISKILDETRGLSYEEAQRILDIIAGRLSSIPPTYRLDTIATMKEIVYAFTEESLSNAVKKMRGGGFSQLPVKTKTGVFRGNLTELSILRFLLKPSNNIKLEDAKVGDLSGYFEIPPEFSGEESLQSLARLFETHYAVVLKNANDEIAGIVTRADLLKVIK